MNRPFIQLLRIRLFPGLTFSLIAFGWLNLQQSRAATNFISASNRVDMVYDAPRDVLYITASNSVLRYQLQSSSFLTPFQLGGNLQGIDLSPDGNILLVADNSGNSSNIWVHKIDLNTEQATQVFFMRNLSERGTYAIAFGGDGAALITGTAFGSASVWLRRYDPVSGLTTLVTTTNQASINQNSMVSCSADGTTIILAQANSSAGPFNRYDVWPRALVRKGNQPWYNYECAANRDGSLFAIPTGGGTYIYDGNFNHLTNIGVYFGEQPNCAAFHPSADAVFFPFVGTTYVRVYSTTTWEMLAQFDCQYTFSSRQNAFENGRIRITRDGEIFFVTVGGGVRFFRHNLSFPTPPFRITHSVVRETGGDRLLLRWPSLARKTYNIWFTPDLSSPFAVISNDIVATPPYNTYMPPVDLFGIGYFRVEAN